MATAVRFKMMRVEIKKKYILIKRGGRRRLPWQLLFDGKVIDRFPDFLAAWQVMKSARYNHKKEPINVR